MKKYYCLIAVVMVFQSCASLSKSQLKAVNQFAKNASNFSYYPSQLLQGLSQIRTTRSIFFANSLKDPNLHLTMLDSIFFNEQHNNNISKKVDLTFKIIDKYAKTLELISSDKYEKKLYKQTDQLGEGIEELVSSYNDLADSNKLPTGLGGPINSILSLGGKQLIRSKQAKIIKEFVPIADTLVAVMTANLLTFLKTTTLNEIILNEERSIRNSYLSFLKHSSNSFVIHDTTYLKLKFQITALKQLQLNCIKATLKLRKAHTQLTNSILKKKKLKELHIDFKDFLDQINEIRNSVEKLHKK